MNCVDKSDTENKDRYQYVYMYKHSLRSAVAAEGSRGSLVLHT